MSLVMSFAPIPNLYLLESMVLSGLGSSVPDDTKLRLKVQAQVRKAEAGIDELKRLPWAGGTVPALNMELKQIKSMRDLKAALKATEALRKKIRVTRKQARGAVKKEQKQAKRDARKDRRSSTDKIAYDSEREEVVSLLAKIEEDPFVRTLGDLGSRIDQVRRGMSDADETLADGKASDAIKAMKKLQDECKAIRKERNKIIKNLHSKHRPIIKDAAALSSRIGSATVLSQDDVTRLRNTLTSFVASLADNPRDKAMATAVKEDIKDLSDEVEELIKERESAQSEAARVALPAITQARDLLQIALGRQVIEVLKKADDTERMLTQNDHAGATKLAGELVQAVPPLRAPLLQDKDDWEGTADLRKLTRAELVEQKTLQDSGDFAFIDDPSELIAAMDALPPAVMVSRTYAECNAVMEAVHDGMTGNAAQRRDWENLAPKREEEQEKFEAAFKEAQEAIEAVAAAMVSAMKAKGDLPGDWAPHDVGGLQGQLDDIAAQWRDLCKRACDEADMDASIAVLMLSSLRNEAQRLLDSDAKLGEALDTDAMNRARAAHDKERAAITGELAAWDLYPLRALKAVRKELAETQARLTSAGSVEEIQALTTRLENIHSKANGEAFLLEKTLEAERNNLDSRMGKAREAVAALKKKATASVLLEKSALKKTRDRCAQEAERLAEQLDTIAGRRSAQVVDVVIEAISMIHEVETRSAALLRLCEGKPETVPLLPDTFAQVIKANRVLLKSKSLKKYRPSDRLILTRDLDAIDERLGGGEHTTRIQKSLDEWAASHAEARARVQKDIQQKQEFDQIHKETKALLKDNSKLFELYPKFYEKLKGDLSSAMQQSETEDGVNSAIGSLLNVKTTLERLIAAGTEDSGAQREQLKNGEASAQAAEDRGKKQEAVWKARVEAFEKRWMPKISSNPRKDDVEQLLESARSAADGDAPNYDSANRYLEMAAQRAMLIIEFPDGPVATSLSRLPTEEKNWRKAVINYQESFAGLRDHFSSLDQPARKELTAGVEELKRMFDSDAFARPVQRICLKGADTKDRAAARESALGTVRRYREELVRDPRFRLLRKHPFQDAGVAAWSGHLIIQRSLIELERLLLMAVPTT